MTLEFGVTEVTDVWTVEAGSHLRMCERKVRLSIVASTAHITSSLHQTPHNRTHRPLLVLSTCSNRVDAYTDNHTDVTVQAQVQVTAHATRRRCAEDDHRMHIELSSKHLQRRLQRNDGRIFRPQRQLQRPP